MTVADGTAQRRRFSPSISLSISLDANRICSYNVPADGRPLFHRLEFDIVDQKKLKCLQKTACLQLPALPGSINGKRRILRKIR
jgi:hypothetical protein